MKLTLKCFSHVRAALDRGELKPPRSLDRSDPPDDVQLSVGDRPPTVPKRACARDVAVRQAGEHLYEQLRAAGLEVLLDDPFEEPNGWTAGVPGDDATTGIWVRADPVGTAAQPEDDHTPTPGTGLEPPVIPCGTGDVFIHEVQGSEASSPCEGATVTIELLQGGNVCATIATAETNDGAYTWTAAKCSNTLPTTWRRNSVAPCPPCSTTRPQAARCATPSPASTAPPPGSTRCWNYRSGARHGQ